jgi:hypothetical protein
MNEDVVMDDKQRLNTAIKLLKEIKEWCNNLPCCGHIEQGYTRHSTNCELQWGKEITARIEESLINLDE